MGHCNPRTATGSGDVHCYSKQAHRNFVDKRDCGAFTIVVGQKTVRVNGELWAVKDDPNSHGDGNLINTGSSVRIAGKFVIVSPGDPAKPDDLCGSDGGGSGGAP